MPLFTEYLARCHLLLQEGVPVADVLWYLGDDLDHKPRQDTPFPQGWTFNYLNHDALINRLSVSEGSLRTPEGLSWRLIWLAPGQCRRLTPTTLERLLALLQEGATVIGPPPEVNASLTDGVAGDARFAHAINAIWGDKAAASGDRRVGKGRILWGSDLAASLSKLDIQPDVIGAKSASWCHRKTADSDIYFIAADRVQPLRANLRFRAKGTPELWDPLTGHRQVMPVSAGSGQHTTVPLELDAAGSVFVVFRHERSTNAASYTSVRHDDAVWLDAADTSRTDQGEPYPNFGLRATDVVQPWIDPAPPTAEFRTVGGQPQFLAWRDGTYVFRRGNEVAASIRVEGSREESLISGWSLAFPHGWDAPAQQPLPSVGPWSELSEPATRAFSGTATYTRLLNTGETAPGDSIMLDLGRVENIAQVRVNGRLVSTRWSPPYRFDLTTYLTGREDRLEVSVTNTWRNRLAYDATLAENERRTWTINAPPANAPLVPAGIIGPVLLRWGRTSPMPVAEKPSGKPL